MTNAIYTPNTYTPGLPPPQTAAQSGSTGSTAVPPPQDAIGSQKACWFRNPARTFPITHFSEKNKQTLVRHPYPNQDNQRLENTGFNARVWTLIIPCTNNINPGPQDTWKRGQLFGIAGNLFDQLTVYFQDKTSGALQLPDKQVIAKVSDWEYTETGEQPRDGAIITVTFEECIDDNVSITQTIGKGNAGSTLSSLSASGQQLTNLITPNMYPPGLNLSFAFRAISNIVKQYQGKVNSVINSINNTSLSLQYGLLNTAALAQTASSQSYNLAKSIYQQFKYSVYGATPPVANSFVLNLDTLSALHTSYQSCFNCTSISLGQFINRSILFTQNTLNYYASLNSIYTMPIQDQLLAFLVQLQTIVNTQPRNAQQIFTFITINPMTFVQVARYTSNDIGTIMSLNVGLSNTMIIPPNVQVQYYSNTGY